MGVLIERYILVVRLYWKKHILSYFNSCGAESKNVYIINFPTPLIPNDHPFQYEKIDLLVYIICFWIFHGRCKFFMVINGYWQLLTFINSYYQFGKCYLNRIKCSSGLNFDSLFCGRRSVILIWGGGMMIVEFSSFCLTLYILLTQYFWNYAFLPAT